MIRDAQGVLTLFLRSADPPADTCMGNTVTAEQAPEHKVRQVTTKSTTLGNRQGCRTQQTTNDDKGWQLCTAECTAESDSVGNSFWFIEVHCFLQKCHFSCAFCTETCLSRIDFLTLARKHYRNCRESGFYYQTSLAKTCTLGVAEQIGVFEHVTRPSSLEPQVTL